MSVSVPVRPRAPRAAAVVAAALGAVVAAAAWPSAPRAEEAAETARLAVGDDISGLPAPAGASDVSRTTGPVLRELKARVDAAPVVVLAFYRAALGGHGWVEGQDGAVDSVAEIRRSFSGAEGSAVLVLTRAAEQTAVSLVIRASEEVVAARAQEAREAERAARGEQLADNDPAGADAGQPDLGRTAALLRPRADVTAPIPVPETADAVAVDGSLGRLTFTSPASVRALEMFYRGTLRARGYVERPAESHPGVAALEFVKGEPHRAGEKAGEKKTELPAPEPLTEDKLIVTFVRDGGTVTVTATGNALKGGH